MAIVRWEPVRELLSTQDRFNRMFNDVFGRSLGIQGDEQLGVGAWAPPVDIYESEHNLVLKAELPGVDPKDVDIRVENNTLYLKGERKLEKDVKEENYHRIERTYGTFTRSFNLPGSIDANKVEAQYKDGMLTLTMPKREEAKPKTIKINVAGSEEPKQAAAARS